MSDPTTVSQDSTDVLRYDEAYQRLFDEIRNVPSADVMVLNLDIPTAVTTVLGALPKINALRPIVVSQLPQHDIARFDKLESYTLAVGHAHALFLAASAPAEPLDQLSQAATETRDLLFSDASALARRNLIDQQKLDDLKGGTGYRNVAFDLFALAAMMRQNWAAISGNTGLKMTEIDQGAKLADRLLTAVGLREQNPAIVAASSDNRQRAFTLFVTAYDQIRRAVSYLRWNEDDVDQIAPSLYAGRGTSKKKSAVPQPVTPATPASPAAPNASTAASSPNNGSPAVAVGHPQSSPFTNP